MMPPAWLPQIPKARVSSSSDRPRSRPAAAAAAKPAVRLVGWKWRAWNRPGTVSPTRHITSTAATVASRSAAPVALVASATARAEVTAAQPVWTIASSRVSSKSRPWARVPLASTALAGATRVAVPMTELTGGPPRAWATRMAASPKSMVEDARQLPRMSSTRRWACSTTSPGSAARRRSSTNRARRRAAASSLTRASSTMLSRHAVFDAGERANTATQRPRGVPSRRSHPRRPYAGDAPRSDALTARGATSGGRAGRPPARAGRPCGTPSRCRRRACRAASRCRRCPSPTAPRG